MFQIEQIVEGIEDQLVLEEYTERIELVVHKLKFMDAVPVALLDMEANQNPTLSPFLELAGGLLAESANQGVYIIFAASGADLNNMMANVPALLDAEWQAVQNNRVALLNLDIYNLEEAKDRVSLLEDLAEILHPGSFIFGNEGNAWIRFGS